MPDRAFWLKGGHLTGINPRGNRPNKGVVDPGRNFKMNKKNKLRTIKAKAKKICKKIRYMVRRVAFFNLMSDMMSNIDIAFILDLMS